MENHVRPRCDKYDRLQASKETVAFGDFLWYFGWCPQAEIMATPPGHLRVRIPDFWKTRRPNLQLQRNTSHKKKLPKSHWISAWFRVVLLAPWLFGWNGLSVGGTLLSFPEGENMKCILPFGVGCMYFFSLIGNGKGEKTKKKHHFGHPNKERTKKVLPPRGSQKIHRSATLRDAFLQRCDLAASVLGLHIPKIHHQKMLMSIQLKKM